MNKWDLYFMDLAVRTSQLSSCERLKVGAVAVRDKRPILTGFNGTPPGWDNCCEEEVYPDWYERLDFCNGGPPDKIFKTKPEVSHAEENLITHAAKYGVSLKDTTLYITHAPCINCAKLIFNAGIIGIVYRELYRNGDGLDYLEKAGVSRIEPYVRML